MHKAEIPCYIETFNVAWKCLQLHQSWQSWRNHCHNQNPCVHLLCQHIVWGREQVLDHPSSNSLVSEGIYWNTPSAHFVLLCQGWKVWATRTGLSSNGHYCPLQDSYAYVTFNKSASHETQEPVASDVTFYSVSNCTMLFNLQKVVEHFVNYLFWLWTITCIHDQHGEFIGFPLASTLLHEKSLT